MNNVISLRTDLNYHLTHFTSINFPPTAAKVTRCAKYGGYLFISFIMQFFNETYYYQVDELIVVQIELEKIWEKQRSMFIIDQIKFGKSKNMRMCTFWHSCKSCIIKMMLIEN